MGWGGAENEDEEQRNETKKKRKLSAWRWHKKAAGNFFIMQKRVHKKCQKCQREQPKYKIYNIFKCNKAAREPGPTPNPTHVCVCVHTRTYTYTYVCSISLPGIRLINVYRIAALCVFMHTCVRIYKSRNSCVQQHHQHSANIPASSHHPRHPFSLSGINFISIFCSAVCNSWMHSKCDFAWHFVLTNCQVNVYSQLAWAAKRKIERQR